MAITSRRLEERGAATAVNGAATVTLGPVPFGAVWRVDQVVTQVSVVSTAIPVPKGNSAASVVITRGPVGSPNIIDSTTAASNARSSPAGLTLYAGEVIAAAFSAVQPGGSRCQITLLGQQEPLQ